MATHVIRTAHRLVGKRIGGMAPQWLIERYREWTTDVYVVSFPKSGRTWFRTIIGTALQLRFGAEEVDPTSVHHMWKFDGRIPRFNFTHDVNAHLIAPDQVTWEGDRYRNKSTILLVRDPRDTIVSLYFEMSKRVHAYEGSIEAFIRQDTGGIASLVAFLNEWIRNRDKLRRSLLLSYEDLHGRPVETIGAALQFAGVDDVPTQTIEHALELCSFDAMRRMERSGSVTHVRLRPGNVDDLESYKVRRGKVGGYVDTLSPQDCAFLDDYIARNLDERWVQYKGPSPDVVPEATALRRAGEARLHSA